MSTQKIHIGPNGPAPCRATVRPCEYEVSGTKEEVTRIWEKQQEALFADSMLAGVSKSAVKGKTEPETPSEVEADVRENPSKIKATSVLSSRDKYIPSVETVQYEESEKDIAMKLALSNLTELSYTPVQSEDTEWASSGCTNVDRYILEDGSVGYFKSFGKNSHLEDSFQTYGTSSLGAAINEVNAYRMAQAFGGAYADLVPETVIREINGSLGTLQRGVFESDEYNPDDAQELQSRRSATIFDFVIGNQDRHEENYFYAASKEDEGSPASLKLIDNSFSFPPEGAFVNLSVFTDGEGGGAFLYPNERVLTENDLDDLRRARTAVEGWIGEKTIDPALGQGTIERIDYLIEAKRTCNFWFYAEEPTERFPIQPLKFPPKS